MLRSSKKQNLNKNLLKPSGQYLYGTAGYRLNTKDLNNVLCRASIIAYIRSSTFAGKYIGLYITASHNPIEYNGIKFIDFNGNMLEDSWELNSDELVNSEDQDFNSIINKIFRQNSNYTGMNDSIYGNILIGRDTRDSGSQIVNNIKEVLKEYRCNVHDYEVVSCPEMHYLVRKSNELNEIQDKSIYLAHLHSNYTKLKELTKNEIEMGIDTANGVIGLKFEELLKMESSIKVEILNENGILNKDCGADFVKSHKSPPKIKKSEYSLSASFDGDADRLILYNSNKIFDGDVQAVFIAQYLKNLVEKENLNLEIAVILSHYSNSGAIEYLNNKNFKVQLSQTGVKNFVKEAKKFDIGIYFEPNGHGSVIFSKKFQETVEKIKNENVLKVISFLFDPCVGDALANFLIFKTLLISEDDLNIYKESVSRLLTVKIKDKNKVKVDSNYLVVEPDIQKEIDQLNLTFKGRGFVRPSGTEDLIRIFAESSNEAQCDKLALNIAQLVYDTCEGVGNYPEISYQEQQ